MYKGYAHIKDANALMFQDCQNRPAKLLAIKATAQHQRCWIPGRREFTAATQPCHKGIAQDSTDVPRLSQLSGCKGECTTPAALDTSAYRIQQRCCHVTKAMTHTSKIKLQ